MWRQPVEWLLSGKLIDAKPVAFTTPIATGRRSVL